MKNRIIIDCECFVSKEALHTTLKEKIKNQNYIGNNLDAMFDALSSVNEPIYITFINVTAANCLLGDYFNRFVKVVFAAVNDNDNIYVTFLY